MFVVLIDAIHRMTQSVPRRTQTLRDDYTKKKRNKRQGSSSREEEEELCFGRRNAIN